MSRRRKAAHAHGNHERWLVSYADFITLLFAFFVVLYASSRSDKTKTLKMAVSIEEAFTQLGLFQPAQAQPEIQAPPADTPTPDSAVAADRISLVALQRQLSVALGPEIQRGEVNLNLNRQGLVIDVQELGFFDSGSDQLSPDSLPVLQKIGTAVARLPNPIRVEGYTDNIPIHNQRFTSNWQLSTARAARLVRLFITRFRVDPERLSAAGYAQYHPIASNATPEGRQRNRRVDVVVESLEAARATAPEGLAPTTPLIVPAKPTVLPKAVSARAPDAPQIPPPA